jgi:hypothetical protein
VRACVAATGCNDVLGNEAAMFGDDGVDGGSTSIEAAAPTADDDPAPMSDAGPSDDAAITTDTDAGNVIMSDDAGTPIAADAGTAPTKDAGSAGSPGCPGTEVRCGILCVDLQSDPLHCGDCATVCKAPPMCKQGQCKH